MSLIKSKKYKNILLNISKNLNTKYDHEFNLSVSDGFTVTCRSGNVESIEHHQDTLMSVTVYSDYRKGSASIYNHYLGFFTNAKCCKPRMDGGTYNQFGFGESTS